jgi:hypothetical protein
VRAGYRREAERVDTDAITNALDERRPIPRSRRELIRRISTFLELGDRTRRPTTRPGVGAAATAR